MVQVAAPAPSIRFIFQSTGIERWGVEGENMSVSFKASTKKQHPDLPLLCYQAELCQAAELATGV